MRHSKGGGAMVENENRTAITWNWELCCRVCSMPGGLRDKEHLVSGEVNAVVFNVVNTLELST